MSSNLHSCQKWNMTVKNLHGVKAPPHSFVAFLSSLKPYTEKY